MVVKGKRCDANIYDRLSLALQVIQVLPMMAAGGMLVFRNTPSAYLLAVVGLLVATGLALTGNRMHRRMLRAKIRRRESRRTVRTAPPDGAGQPDGAAP
jgi:hypothetical protein